MPKLTWINLYELTDHSLLCQSQCFAWFKQGTKSSQYLPSWETNNMCKCAFHTWKTNHFTAQGWKSLRMQHLIGSMNPISWCLELRNTTHTTNKKDLQCWWKIYFLPFNLLLLESLKKVPTMKLYNIAVPTATIFEIQRKYCEATQHNIIVAYYSNYSKLLHKC